MFYNSILNLMRSTFKKLRLKTAVISIESPFEFFEENTPLFSPSNIYDKKSIIKVFPEMKTNTVYRLKDNLFRCYIILLLPEKREVLIIGPYLSGELSKRQILENAEQAGFSPRYAAELEAYYDSIPEFSDESPIFSMLDSFCEELWGGEGMFRVEDIDSEIFDIQMSMPIEYEETSPEQIKWNMKKMEERYSYENRIIYAVSHGQTHKIERLLNAFSVEQFEKRSSDPVRNLKNYCIIMNTLLRKAAESGGVHPVYIDKISSDFAKKIENNGSVSTLEGLMSEMFKAYCELVKNYSIKNYSPTVQKIITIIDFDLTADLTLNSLAKIQNVNASYLSSLFKKETGKSLTDFVNEKRINNAKRLLRTTNLQVQTVAQHCGVMDVHYFTKLFKKYTGNTPKEYRITKLNP